MRRQETRILCAFALWFAVVGAAWAQSTMDAAKAFSWGANIGWTNWRPSSQDGVVVTEYTCAGYVYSANVGWIHLGDGQPANGLQYQNNSADDYGVNHDQLGILSGFAYGANVGWIQFEERGAPRIDLTTGQLSGHVYGANIGWISLDGLRISSLALGTDRDLDGIPDAWEFAKAGDLARLSRAGDADQDGSTDFEEYVSDTHPMDSNDALRITQFTVTGDISTLVWPSKRTRNYVVQSRSVFDPGTSWDQFEAVFRMGTGQLLTAEMRHGGEPPHRFFRVQAVRPLADSVAE